MRKSFVVLVSGLVFGSTTLNCYAITTGFENLPTNTTFAANALIHAGDVNIRSGGNVRFVNRGVAPTVDLEMWLPSFGVAEFLLPAVVDQFSFRYTSGNSTNRLTINGASTSSPLNIASTNGTTLGGVAISVSAGLVTLNGPVQTFTIMGTELSIDEVFINAPTPTADFDQDGDADGNDFLQWQRGLGVAANGSPTTGDADFDHDVDNIDLVNWRGRFGRTTGALNATVTAVPEPAGATMLCAALLSAARASFNRRAQRSRNSYSCS